MAVVARLISMSKDQKEAEVVVAEGKSVTRHVRLRGGRWVGRNPDEEGLIRLETMELLYESAHRHYQQISQFVGGIPPEQWEKFVEDVKSGMDVPPIISLIGRSLLESGNLSAENLKTAVNSAVEEDHYFTEDLREVMERVQEETPGEVEFSF